MFKINAKFKSIKMSLRKSFKLENDRNDKIIGTPDYIAPEIITGLELSLIKYIIRLKDNQYQTLLLIDEVLGALPTSL